MRKRNSENGGEWKVGAEDPYVGGKPLRRRKSSQKTLKIVKCWGVGGSENLNVGATGAYVPIHIGWWNLSAGYAKFRNIDLLLSEEVCM
jgi:hypothetical protein